MKTRRKYIKPTLTENGLALRNMILAQSSFISGDGESWGEGEGGWGARQRYSGSGLNFQSQSSIEQINWDF